MFLNEAKLKEVLGGEGAEMLASDAAKTVGVNAVQVELSYGPVDPAQHMLLCPLCRVCHNTEDKDII